MAHNDEKWWNVIGSTVQEQLNDDKNKSTEQIILRKIPTSEQQKYNLKPKRVWKLESDADDSITKITTATTSEKLEDFGEKPILAGRPKKNKELYYVKDQYTKLSNEDIHYQLMNSSDIVQKKRLLPTVLKLDVKTKESIEKLFRHPERFLPPKLMKMYRKNLEKATNFEDFQISYDDIEKDVKRLIQLRKSIKKQRISRNCQQKDINSEIQQTIQLKPKPLSEFDKTTKRIRMRMFNIKDEDDEESVDLTSQTIDNNYDRLQSVSRFSNNNQNSILTKLDHNFKPTILLSTKTYSRKQIKNEN